MELTLETMNMWKKDPVVMPLYHETKILFARTEGPSQTVVDNYESLTGESPATLIDPNPKKDFAGIFRDGYWSGVSKCTWNPTAGWGEAEEALRSVIQAAADSGEQYVVADVNKIIFTDGQACSGVDAKYGRVVRSEHTVLCTGARTAQLLADNSPDVPELQVNGRMVAAAAAMGLFEVPEDQMFKFESAHIPIHSMGDIPAETIPPGPKRLCKCTHELSFTNNIYHETSKQTISVPPEPLGQSIWSQDLPKVSNTKSKKSAKNLQDVLGSCQTTISRNSSRKTKVPIRDAVTPNQDWIICPHPASCKLYIAAGGSFHGWKFLVNVGKYVTQMLDGKLDETEARRWAWDRLDDGGACAMYLPSRDLKDIDGYTGMSQSV
ncbi:sarcosine oxidase [Aulographum hederae CBS 113979]|uniref:Sarcosine oxidase n=1 Tax=Aulographum hederae CBS 113979 TaxID=1176131 RepID=A0A6G1GQR8_9PEZI|nr:sarcosine oxidase [Aulographum hederae CBS 113979]